MNTWSNRPSSLNINSLLLDAFLPTRIPLPINYNSFLKFQFNYYVLKEIFPDHQFFGTLKDLMFLSLMTILIH